LNLTLGPLESKVVARSNQFVSINVMPLFLRADHRLADAQQVGRFLAAVRDLLSHPERLNSHANEPTAQAGFSESPVKPTAASA
ncbi:MAG: 2-oxo acid dehydrogenase subunit E2, partial [Pseudolabrys sp.]